MTKQTKTTKLLKALDDLANVSNLDVTAINNGINTGVEHGAESITDSGNTDSETADATLIEALEKSDKATAQAQSVLVPTQFDKRGNVTKQTIESVADAALARLKAISVDVDGICPVTSMAVLGADGHDYYVGITSEKYPGGIPMESANNKFFPDYKRPSGAMTKPLDVNTPRCQAYLFAYRSALALSGGEPVELRGDMRVTATLIAGGFIAPANEKTAFVAGPNMQHGAPPVTHPLTFASDKNDCTYTVRIFRAA